MDKIVFLTILLFVSLYSKSQMKSPEEWVGYESVMGVKNGLRHYDYDVKTIYSSAPANVFWPGDDVRFKFQLVSNVNEKIDVLALVHIIQYGTRGIPNDIWTPEIYKIKDVLTLNVPVKIAPNGYLDVDLSPDIPDFYGGYAVIFDLGKYGRRVATSFVRSMKPSPIKMQYPKQSLDDLGVDFLSRVGVQSIRYGISYYPTSYSNYQNEMQRIDAEMKKYMDNNITVLLMFGEGPTLTPLGTQRSFLDDSGVYKRTKQDYVWLPSLDSDFKKYVKELCLKYGWPKGPVTAVSLWNEPWEGISISGWQSDMLRYREIYKSMAEGVLEARTEGVDVLVGGCDSNSNAWDKLFSDGTMEFLPIFDFLSIHYQGMESPVLYPEWNNRKYNKGRVQIWDTESWVGNTDDRIGLVVAANRSAGYDRSMGIYGGYMYSGDPHSTTPNIEIYTENGIEIIPSVHSSWSSASAMGAVQSLIGERDFKELLFKNGLPWIMVFDGYDNNPDNGTILITGDLGEAFGPDNILFRNVSGQNVARKRLALVNKLRSKSLNSNERRNVIKQIQEYEPLKNGKLTLKAHPSFILYDFYGNRILPNQGKYIIPLTYNGYYMRTDGRKGSFEKLQQALKESYIEGYQPVEIIAKDMDKPIPLKPEMELVVTNVLNRPISGALNVELGELNILYPSRILLSPHETKTFIVKIDGGKIAVDNTYPLSIYLDAGHDGIAVHWEEMHVNYISKKTVNIDGELDDWTGVLPQSIRESVSSISLTEAAWYPFKNFDKRASGMSTAYLAYDDQYFYFAAKVADSTPNKGTYRFETIDDEEFFYPDVSYMQRETGMKSVVKKYSTSIDDKKALQVPDSNVRILNCLENTETVRSIGFRLSLPQDSIYRTALYFPGIDQYNLKIVVTDLDSGKKLLEHKISKLWDGAFLNLDLSGNLEIRCTAEGWWYTVKLAGVFFDLKSENLLHKSIASLVGKDFDTKGDWLSVYGSSGYWIYGMPPKLPKEVVYEEISRDDFVELRWPEGVRRFSYRKDPVLPDASMDKPADNILIAFNVLPIGEDGMESHPKGTMPRYVGYKCTDYEYALNTVSPDYGGGFEIWRMLVPGMPRKHFYPRQPKSPFDGPVKNGKLITRREGNTLYTECALPWSEIPEVKKCLDKGEKIKFSYRVNDDGAGGACMELARKRSVSKRNSRAFHPDWKEHWANELEFSFEK